ncbi:MAG: ribonuclease Z [Actinomycetales bacterium]
MPDRALVVLGTSAGVPTRMRNHSGFVLLWDRERLLVDPGEGTQRQLQHVGVSAGSLSRIAVTHAHGDHCLGLPGVLQRRVFDGIDTPVAVHAPAAAVPRLQQLVGATHHGGPQPAEWRPEPGAAKVAAAERGAAERGAAARGAGPAPTERRDAPVLQARELDHRVPCVGYRWQEPDGYTVLPERLHEAGVAGPDVGRLLREGILHRGGTTVTREQVTLARRGQSVAFVLDTRRCDAAVALARDVDLLVIEATYLDRDRDLAERYGHLTAAQAAQIAAEAGAHRLVLVHVSPRYGDDAGAVADAFLTEAGRWHADVVMPQDLETVELPKRRRLPA